MSVRLAPFSPSGPAVTVSFAVKPTSDFRQFDNILPQQAGGFTKARSVRLFNAGPDLIFFELRGTQGTETADPMTGVPLGAGKDGIFACGGATVVAAVSATSTGALLYVTPGEGGVF
jgi:hypothetical protein